MQNYIISDNNNNILFILDNIKLCFNIIKNLYSSQLDLLLNNKFNNNMILPQYFITYNKDHNINIYLFKISNKNLFVYYNDELSTDEYTENIILHFKKKYKYNEDDVVEIQKELKKQMDKLKIIKTSYNNDLDTFNKINNDVTNNKITLDEINPIFRNKYEFFKSSNDNINEYEKKFYLNLNN